MFEIMITEENNEYGLSEGDIFTAYKLKEDDFKVWALIYWKEWIWVINDWFKPV